MSSWPRHVRLVLPDYEKDALLERVNEVHQLLAIVERVEFRDGGIGFDAGIHVVERAVIHG